MRSRLQGEAGEPSGRGGFTAADAGDALLRLSWVPRHRLLEGPTPVQEMVQLRAALGGGPRLFVKRDDAIPFGFGGNKVRKAERVVAEAVAAGAETLVTVGGVQSNHARVTAAVAAKLGIRCAVIANGLRPGRPTANALLLELLGAEIEYIASREQRASAISAVVERLRRAGRRPFVVPLGASTPLGALGFAAAVGEVLQQMAPPAAVIHASSSGGTQAGLLLGCALHGVRTHVIGISADDAPHEITARVSGIIAGAAELLGCDAEALTQACPVNVDARFIGDGYGVASDASREAQMLAARSEALFVDHTYTAKALAGLIAHVRERRFRDDDTVLFWHTGGEVGVFA